MKPPSSKPRGSPSSSSKAARKLLHPASSASSPTMQGPATFFPHSPVSPSTSPPSDLQPPLRPPPLTREDMSEELIQLKVAMSSLAIEHARSLAEVSSHTSSLNSRLSNALAARDAAVADKDRALQDRDLAVQRAAQADRRLDAFVSKGFAPLLFGERLRHRRDVAQRVSTAVDAAEEQALYKMEELLEDAERAEQTADMLGHELMAAVERLEVEGAMGAKLRAENDRLKRELDRALAVAQTATRPTTNQNSGPSPDKVRSTSVVAKGLLGDWLTGAEFAVKDGRGEIDLNENAAIVQASKRTSTTSRLEVDVLKQAPEERTRHQNSFKSAVESEFLPLRHHAGGSPLSITTTAPLSSLSLLPPAYITSLATVPQNANVGDLLVSHSKVVAENRYLTALVASLRTRETKALQALRECELTLMNCVRSAETEALKLAEKRAPNIMTLTYHDGTPSPTSGKLHLHQTSDDVRVKELERQTRALVDLLNKQEALKSPIVSSTILSGNNSKKSLAAEVEAATRERDLLDRLGAALDLAGEVRESDLLLELQSLRARYSSAPRHLSREPLEKKTNRKAQNAAAATTTSSALSPPPPMSVAEQSGKMAPATGPAPRTPSQSPPLAVVALPSNSSTPEAKTETLPRMSIERKASFKEKQVSLVAEARTASPASPSRNRRPRNHTVSHSSAGKALDTFNRSYHPLDRAVGDDDKSDSAEVDEDVEEGSSSEWKKEASPEQIEKRDPDFKVILHTTKSYEDPCGDFLRFVMTVSCLGTEKSGGLKLFRYRAYDQDTLRDLEMDIDENVLRASLRDNVSNFTYDESEKRFHEEVLKRLKLIPGHDLNNDGFLNEEDVRRDDLTFALVAPGMWKPLGVMVEVGPRAKKKNAEREKMRATMMGGRSGSSAGATSREAPSTADMLHSGALQVGGGASSGGSFAAAGGGEGWTKTPTWLNQEVVAVTASPGWGERESKGGEEGGDQYAGDWEVTEDDEQQLGGRLVTN